MRNKEKDMAAIAAKQKRILEVSFELFAKNGIEAVTMPQIADASEVGRASLYRYYKNKTELVVAISAWIWDKRSSEMYRNENAENLTAAQEMDYYLESFIDLYRNHSDVLRFNQFFNVYLATQGEKDVKVEPFMAVIRELAGHFHAAYVKGQADGTLNTEVPEKEMFEAMLHLMLAAVTRYAVGLVYGQKADAEKELLLLKSMLLERYTIRKND